MTDQDVLDALPTWKRGMEIATLSPELDIETRKVFKAVQTTVREFVVINDIHVFSASTKFFSAENTSGFIQKDRGLVEGAVLRSEDGDIVVSSVRGVTLDAPVQISMPYVRNASHVFMQDLCTLQVGAGSSSSDDIPGGCVVASTLISVPGGGEIKVEDVQVGDIVLSYNEVSEQVEGKRVLGIDAPLVDRYITLNLQSGTSLGITTSQPVYVRKPGSGIGWASYCPSRSRKSHPYLRRLLKMSAGDFVLTKSGEWDQISSVSEYPGQKQVYNLWAVEDNRNYFADGVLLHNKGSLVSRSTTVLTGDRGVVPISDLASGDTVFSYSEYDGALDFQPIRGTCKSSVLAYWQIRTLSGGTLEISDTQPVYARSAPGEEAWKAIDAAKATAEYPYLSEILPLRAEDELYSKDRAWHPILSIDEHQGPEESVAVWDVANYLTLFANGFLVHNLSTYTDIRYEGPTIAIPESEDIPLLPGTTVCTVPAPLGGPYSCEDLQEGHRVVSSYLSESGRPAVGVKRVSGTSRANISEYYKLGLRLSDGDEHILNALPYQIFRPPVGSDGPAQALDPTRAAEYFPLSGPVWQLAAGDKIHISGEIWGELLYVTRQRGDIQCVIVHT